MPVGIVPSRGIALSNAHLSSAEPVQGIDWRSMMAAYDAVDGMGSALIPLCYTSSYELSGTTSITFTTWPRYQCTHRLWLYAASLDGASDDSPTARCTFTDPSGGTSNASVPSSTSTEDAPLQAHVETVTSRTSAEIVLSPSFSLSLGTGLLHAIGCFELPRSSLAVGGSDLLTTDAGANAAIAASGYPIDDDYAGNGIGFIARHMDDLRDAARRTGLFAAMPFAGTTSASFVTVLQAAPVTLGRCLYNGQTQSVMQLAIDATVSGAGVQGEVRVTMASGASVTIGIPQTGQFRSQILIDCEDLTATDGRRSSRDETVTVELRRTSASGTVGLNTINGGEGAAAAVASVVASSAGPLRRPFARGPLPPFMADRRR